MKTKTKLLTCVVLTTPVLIWLGCDSMKSRHVVATIPPETPSIEAVDQGYDTVGRMWTAEELARMRRSRAEAKQVAASTDHDKEMKAAAKREKEMAAAAAKREKEAAKREKEMAAASRKEQEKADAASRREREQADAAARREREEAEAAARRDREREQAAAKARKESAGANGSATVRAATPPPAATSSVIEVKAGVVNLTIKAPAEVSVSETVCYDLTVTALDNVTNVFVEQILPDDAQFLSADPRAKEDGKMLSWNYPTMGKGDKRMMKVCVKSMKAGALTSCATVYTKPQYCATTMVGKPVLAMTHSGPDTVMVTSNATYTIVVSNKGDGVARNLVVNDPVPEGFSHATGKDVVSFELGNLAPNESKTVSVTFKAMKRGKVCNVAEAMASNAEKVSAEACTMLLKPDVKIVKTGQEQQFINKAASYKIVVSNVGDTDLSGLTVVDTAPEGTTFASAGGGGVSGNTATWKNIDLKKGEERSFNVSLMNKNKGEYCNTAVVTTATGERQEAKACTKWLGVSALLLEVVDDPDPLLIDETTTYTIRVMNQGTADVKNLGLTANFSKQLEPVSADKGAVSGNSVKFDVVPSIAPKQTLTFTIKAKAVNVGDGRVKVSMSSDMLETPVTKEESTRVY